MQPVLSVDLSSGKTEKIDISQDWEKKFIGGASLAARFLYNYLVPQLDPFSPESPLLFLNGPLSGTSGPAVGRFVVCGRSPATGLWGESNCGGFWGVELRKAGYIGMLLTGKAPDPVYISIDNDQVGIIDARRLWGMETYQAQASVLSELNNRAAKVAVIGPAGEARTPFALILTDHGRVAGRTGMGAVMGSKNLKAIAVTGSGEVPLTYPEAFLPLRSETNRALRQNPVSLVARELGTASVSDYMDYLGLMPKRYFKSEYFEGTANISGSHIKDTILAGISACHACVIACGRIINIDWEGAGKPEKRKGAEFETLVGFGPNLLIDDLAKIQYLGELCDRYGFDSISLSGTIGLAFALYEEGYLTEKDTGGLKLVWGDANVVEELIHLTAKQQGFGDWLAGGSRTLAKAFGAAGKAVEVNGLELAYHDPRGASGMALVYATSPRGACHNQSPYYFVEIGQVETELGLECLPRQGGAEKAKNVALHQDWTTLLNSLVMCIFANVPPETVVDLLSAATGTKYDLHGLLFSGERGWNLKRAINNRLGLRKTWDILPEAVLQPYPNSEKSKGFVPDLESMLAAYYAFRDWDPMLGIPSREKLTSLDLGWVADDLWGGEKE